MEDLKLKDFLGFDTKMRKEDHQIISDVLRRHLQEGREVRCREDRPRLGARRATILAKDVDQPNTCKMKRPGAS